MPLKVFIEFKKGIERFFKNNIFFFSLHNY